MPDNDQSIDDPAAIPVELAAVMAEPMSDCIDLRQVAGSRYRLAHEYGRDVRTTDDPWLLTIPCRYGHVYPQGGDRLGFASNSRGKVARAVAELPGATVVQDGEDGMNITFPLVLFSSVAELVKPRRRRQLSSEQRAACVGRLAKYRF